MQKFILSLALATGVAASCCAQFNELDLIGNWELASCEGSYPGFTSSIFNDYFYITPSDCKYLHIGTVTSETSLPGTTGSLQKETVFSGGLLYPENIDLTTPAGDEYEDDYEHIQDYAIALSDFSITNENKLHISPFYGIGTFRFIIETLDKGQMILKSYDGKCTITYLRASDSKVNAITSDSAGSNQEYYNLQGIRLKEKGKGLNIIHREGKATKELN